MAEAERREQRSARSGKKGSVDPAALARIDTELRNQLSGRDPEFQAAVLARTAGQSAAVERRPLDEWFQAAGTVLLDERGLAARVEAAGAVGQRALALLVRQGWWMRAALVQALALAEGVDSSRDQDATLGAAIAEVLAKWPVLVRTNAFTRTEELSLFEPLAARVRPLLDRALSIPRTRGGARVAPVGLGKSLLALALFPGVVAQRRPRTTRAGELHAADATKIERTLGDARGLFATWEGFEAFEDVDGALSPVVARILRLLETPGGLVAEWLERRLGRLGWALACVTANGEEGDRLSLGGALLALALDASTGVGFDVASLAARVERDDLRFSPLLLCDAGEDLLAIPGDVRAAIRGEPLVTGPAAAGFVQPNYEVVLPPGVPLAAAFVVACAAELTHFEAVARLRISRETVLAARAVGLEGAQIVDALAQIGGPRGVPAGVRHAIEEWAASVGEARVRTAVLLEVRAAPALLEKVEAKLSPVLLDRPAPQLFVLSRAPTPRESAALRAIGVVVRAVAQAGHGARDGEDGDAGGGDERSVGTAFARQAGFADGAAPRDLRRALDPHRVMALVEASRPAKRAAPTTRSTPPSSVRTALDPDDDGERRVPVAVESAVEELRVAWGSRRDWLDQLRALTDGAPFRRASAVSPGALIAALKRASDPPRLQLEVARIAAEASARRVID
jgi:predicted outer membrane lipoprotein